MRPSSSLCAITLALAAAACVEPVEPELGSDELPIEDGVPASAFQIARSASVRFGFGTNPPPPHNCTGTRITPFHVLTALHCVPFVNDEVWFFSGTNQADPTTKRAILSIVRPAGTNYQNGAEDWTDSNGDFADWAVVKLSVSSPGTIATMAWVYPGSDVLGVKVGAGQHEGDPTQAGTLLQRSDYTYSDDDSGGGFLTNQSGGNPGDSGGPFYVGSKVVGTLTGQILDGVWRGRHTSVPHHLAAILNAISYVWPGQPVQNGLWRLGSTLQTFVTPSVKVCQYACDKTAACAAWTYVDNPFTTDDSCYVLGSVTSSVAVATARSALR